MTDITEGIPPNELQQFKHCLQVIPKGEAIVTEGSTGDPSLFLLRVGSVGVYRRIGREQARIASIDAINFFGELALIVGSPRTATIVVESEAVLVYKIYRPDLKTIMAHPTWGEMLVTQLCQDVKQADEQIVRYGNENAKLRTRNEQLVEGFAVLFSAFSEIFHMTADEVVIHSREWTFLQGLDEMMRRYLNARVPEVAEKARSIDNTALETIQNERLLPEKLAYLLRKKS